VSEAEEILMQSGWIKPNSNLLDQAVRASIQQICSSDLPADFSRFLDLGVAFEGFVGPEYVVLYRGDDILEQNLFHDKQDLPDTLIIGSNGSGEFIALEAIAGESWRVVLSPWIDLSREVHIKIGNSFTDFLVRLAAGKEWFSD